MTKKGNNTGPIIEIVFEKVVLYLDRFLLGIGGIAVTLIMLLATANVILRLFSQPIRGVYEVIAYMGAIAVAAALGYTQRRKDHIIVDLISEKYGPVTRRIIDTLSYAIMTLFFALVTKGTILYGSVLSTRGEVSETLKIVFHPFIYCVAIGFAMLTITCFADMIRAAFNFKIRIR